MSAATPDRAGAGPGLKGVVGAGAATGSASARRLRLRWPPPGARGRAASSGLGLDELVVGRRPRAVRRARGGRRRRRGGRGSARPRAVRRGGRLGLGARASGLTEDDVGCRRAARRRRARRPTRVTRDDAGLGGRRGGRRAASAGSAAARLRRARRPAGRAGAALGGRRHPPPASAAGGRGAGGLRGSRLGRGRGVRVAPAAASPGSGRSRTRSGETSKRGVVMPPCSPRQAKAAVQDASVSAAQGLWSRTAIRRRRRPSTRRCSVGRIKRRPRTPNQRPETPSRSSEVHVKRSTSKARSASGSAGVSIRAIGDYVPIKAGTLLLHCSPMKRRIAVDLSVLRATPATCDCS